MMQFHGVISDQTSIDNLDSNTECKFFILNY